MKYLISLIFLCIVHISQELRDVRGTQTVFSNKDAGNPLILTPLINANQLEEARDASEVHLDAFQGVKSFAGFLTVNETFNSNLYFWFFPAEENYEEAPVVLWLQGGPGSSSLFGLFVELGPFEVLSDHSIKLRSTYWSKTQSVIFIDNPVGTGFSFTDDGGYATEQTQVGQQLVTALHQFFKMFPELQKNRFYVTGESYGGKYIPAVSYAILKTNPTAEVPINLQGLAIGNGLCDYEYQINYADYLFELGFIDSNVREQTKEIQKAIVENIHKGEYVHAADLFGTFLGDESSLFIKSAGIINTYNYLFEESPTDPLEQYFGEFLEDSKVREAIHVGNAPFGHSPVYEYLYGDIMKPISSWISELLDHYKIMFYSGQLDIIVAYPLSANFYQHLNFSGADEYRTAERQKWYVGGELAGYFRKGGNLTEVLVRNSGHMAPFDQPENLYDLISNFTKD